MDLFDLSAKITLDSKDYENGLKNAASSAEGFGSKLGSAMKVGLSAVVAVTAAVTALTGAIVAAVGKTAEYGDTVDKQSQKLGMSAQAYQEWDAILQHSGTTIDAMGRGMVTLARQAENNTAAFERLGITQEELATMNQEELFARTIQGLQQMESGTERTALAQELFGGSAKELGALLNTSAEDTEAMRQRVHELGGVMSDEAVKAAAAYQDSLQDMQTAMSGAARTVSAEFMPAITTIMNGLTEIFSGGKGIFLITKGINSFIKKLNEAIPKVVKTGGQIIQQLADAIIANLPTLIEATVPVLTSLAEGLISNLVNSAMQIIVAIANGIAKALPQMTPVIVDVVLGIVETLIDNVDLLVEAAIEIMIALTEGLFTALPQLIERIPELVGKIVSAIAENADLMIEGAFALVAAFASGLFQAVLTVIVDLAKAIINWLNEHILQPIVKFLSDVWAKITAFFKPLLDFIRPILEALKYLFETIWQAILIVVGRVLDSIKQKIESVWNSIVSFLQRTIFEPLKQIVGNAWNAIYQRIAQPLAQIKNAVSNAFNAVKQIIMGVVNSAKNWGRDLIDNFVAGITGGVGRIANAIRGIGDTIRANIGFSEPEEGPLSNFHTYAPDMIDLFIRGVRDNEEKLRRQIAETFDFGDFVVSPTSDPRSGASTFGATSGFAIYGDVHITVDGTGKDAEEIGHDLYDMLLRQGVAAYAY